jgi:hypothetical protein
VALAFKVTTEMGTNIDGVLDWEDNCLVVEFERPRFLRPDEIVRVDIPIEEIDHVEFKPFVFNARLMVRTLYLQTAKDIEWAKGLDIKFLIPKREWDRAHTLVEQIDRAIDAEMSDE